MEMENENTLTLVLLMTLLYHMMEYNID